MATSKYYLLYSNEEQEKFLSTADNDEKLKSETEYYTTGVWFSYDKKENSNLLENEKKMKGIKFPEVAKERIRYSEEGKTNSKWLK
jgi:hypothetical protein